MRCAFAVELLVRLHQRESERAAAASRATQAARRRATLLPR